MTVNPNNKSYPDAQVLYSKRLGGVLLHPTSLPGKYGIGELGSELFRFLDLLKDSGQHLWQMLPLYHTGYGNSPYSALSAFAGNPLLISLDNLAELGLLTTPDLTSPQFNDIKVEYEKVAQFKWPLLQKAYNAFIHKPMQLSKEQFAEYCDLQGYWLNDYALFMALKQQFDGKEWSQWPVEYRDRKKLALEAWIAKNTEVIEYYKFLQFIFWLQWEKVREYAHERNIWIIGDIPIFVCYDSADVWVNKSLFYLDKTGAPLYVAGVPPDYFSKTGQRWGNPLYKWNIIQRLKFKWWIQRVQHAFTQVDILRIDHFRGFEAYWEIPASEPTAIRGRWVKGPDYKLFAALKQALGSLPIIAEDLGMITPEVHLLRKKCGFPGMRVLQFAFGDPHYPPNDHLPHNYDPMSVCYVGTHDNETAAGWEKSMSEGVKRNALKYLQSDGVDMVLDVIRAAWASVSRMAIVTMQDICRLDNEARMNTPAVETGNWEWRFTWDQVPSTCSQELSELNYWFNRNI